MPDLYLEMCFYAVVNCVGSYEKFLIILRVRFGQNQALSCLSRGNVILQRRLYHDKFVEQHLIYLKHKWGNCSRYLPKS